MPYKSEKIAYDCPFLDKRVKLLPCQKEMAFYWREKGLSYNKIANIFKVSKRLIIFIIDPSKQEANLSRRLERGGSKQYYKGGEEWAKTMREHRQRKYNILKDTI